MHQPIDAVSEFDCLVWEVNWYVDRLKRSPYSDGAKAACLRGYLGRLCGVDELLEEIKRLENE